MVKMNFIEKLWIRFESDYEVRLVKSLRIWGKKRDRFIGIFNKTGSEYYHDIAKFCWDEYCKILDDLTDFYGSNESIYA